jgi:hypothetical protein
MLFDDNFRTSNARQLVTADGNVVRAFCDRSSVCTHNEDDLVKTYQNALHNPWECLSMY